MTTIFKLMITSVGTQYNHTYVANAFWTTHIARVKSITMIPYMDRSLLKNIVYITIDQWCDSEAAYIFIRKLKANSAVILNHTFNDEWLVQVNTHNNGNLYVGSFTIDFDDDYFTKRPIQTPTTMFARPTRDTADDLLTNIRLRLSDLDQEFRNDHITDDSYVKLCKEEAMLLEELHNHETMVTAMSAANYVINPDAMDIEGTHAPEEAMDIDPAI